MKLLFALVPIVAFAQSTEVRVLPVQGNVYMLVGAGGNTTIQVGPTGVLLVDTQYAPLSGKIVTEIRKLSNKPIRYILNTGPDADHTDGNEEIAKTVGLGINVTVVNTPGQTASDSVQVIAHDNVLARMTQAKVPQASWPTETYIGENQEFFFNGEPVQIFHEPAAHTDGDSIVFFRRSDVISAGDIFITTGYPIIDLQRGGSLQGVIDGLNHILDLAVPAHHEEGGTYIIPGHGRLCDEFDVLEYRDMVTIVRDRLKAMIKKGMTLDQVKAARPTLDYDPRYGSPNKFIEAAYSSLTQKKK